MTSTTLRRGAAAVLLASAVASAGILLPSVSGAASTKTVKIVDIAYKPKKVTINKGGKVKWVWQDQIVAHTVTSTGSKKFKSSTEKKTGSYTVTFKKTGTYKYYCLVHPNDANMKGTVVVK